MMGIVLEGGPPANPVPANSRTINEVRIPFVLLSFIPCTLSSRDNIQFNPIYNRLWGGHVKRKIECASG